MARDKFASGTFRPKLRHLLRETARPSIARLNSPGKAPFHMHPVLLLTLALAAPAHNPPQVFKADWAAKKCGLYQLAFQDAIGMLGMAGLGSAFLEQNDEVIASGCAANIRVCAKTSEEIALADLLTVMTMNEGMASTFVPFSCKPAT